MDVEHPFVSCMFINCAIYHAIHLHYRMGLFHCVKIGRLSIRSKQEFIKQKQEPVKARIKNLFKTRICKTRIEKN